MKYLCLERCYDNSKCLGYYEDDVYELTKDQVKHLKTIGLIKYFKEIPVEVEKKTDQVKKTSKEESKTQE